ncbi:hypothetical protein TVAG_498210 [Trichomonas vaginalis G3]|uniref:Uncharacterized protein n=1 Tax=Trichomonas vaginalis (strain ATCC PRA-98 / G3) TaxID=412133 RepID=A2FLF1_TRIV3|nr:hypothetical protein TVAGG3_0639110 [Trichomonas vaginalis G3]EAX94267.1 hypothetical protein TVAG_498210 [Trichomonas vaginalis G3]KAI5505033.1 hypothetical protein TVAGG3_0639110 [Trichomonas vaginalis G3]|eukprot:XP_001307197.1 hypothetical protein [Trichomonas vaginalis G3]
MSVRDSFYENEVVGHYNFSLSSEYVLTSVIHSAGIWVGNGMFRITNLSIIIPTCKMMQYCRNIQYSYFAVFILMYSE